MKEIYKDYLFEKHILVSEGMAEEKHVFETLFAMAHFFGVKITKGRELVRCEMVKELSKRFGENVPEPFYRGFPQSVRDLSAEELLFDQLIHYFNTCAGCLMQRQRKRFLREDRARTQSRGRIMKTTDSKSLG